MRENKKNISALEKRYLKNCIKINKDPEELCLIADKECKLKKFNKGIANYKKAIKFCIKTDKKKLLSILYKKEAIAWFKIGDFKNAEAIYIKAIDLDIEIFGDKDSVIAEDLYVFSKFCYSMKKYIKSSRLLQRAINIDEKYVDVYHPNISKKLDRLGDVFFAMNKKEKALSCYEKAFSINKKLYGIEDKYTVKSLSKLACLMKNLKKYDTALIVYEKIKKIEEKLYVKDHYKIALTLNNIASIWSVLKGYVRANDFYDKAENILIKSLGSMHPYTQRISYNKKILEAKWKRAIEQKACHYKKV